MHTEPDGTTMLDDPGEQVDEQRQDDEQRPVDEQAQDAPEAEPQSAAIVDEHGRPLYDENGDAIPAVPYEPPRFIHDIGDGYAAMTSEPESVRHLACDLADDEKIDIGESMKADVLEIERRKALHKGIKEIEERVTEMAHKLNSGLIKRDVECRVVLDCPSPGRKTIYRTDTMEIVETVPMLAHDSQLELPLAGGEASGDGTGEALGDVSQEEQTGSPVAVMSQDEEEEASETSDGESPYYRGKIARKEGKGLYANPYTPSDREFDSWINGWNDEYEEGTRAAEQGEAPEEFDSRRAEHSENAHIERLKREALELPG